MNRINSIAKKYNLSVIEDAAEAMGATYKSRFVGSISDLACFSLYTNKIITTGNGGIVCTDRKDLAELIKKLRFFDYNSEVHFKHNLIGYNMVLSGLQAALGYSQVGEFEKRLKKRRKVYEWYKKELEHEQIGFIKAQDDCLPNYWFPAILATDYKTKKKIERSLLKNSIEPREFFLPIHLQPVYQEAYSKDKFPVAEYFYERGLLLPSYYSLEPKQVSFVCSVIKKALVN